jgi:hypothetical protein
VLLDLQCLAVLRPQSYVTISIVVQELVHGMACGHTFHEYCIVAYANSKYLTLHTVPCPSCKRTRNDLADAADALLAGHGTGSSGSGGQVVDIMDDEMPPADVPGNEEEEDDKGKGKGKAKAKSSGMGKGKSKGKGASVGMAIASGVVDGTEGDVTDDTTTDDGLGGSTPVVVSEVPVAMAAAPVAVGGKGKGKGKAKGKTEGKGNPSDHLLAELLALGDAPVPGAGGKGRGKSKGKGKATAAVDGSPGVKGKGKAKAAAVDGSPGVKGKGKGKAKASAKAAAVDGSLGVKGKGKAKSRASAKAAAVVCPPVEDSGSLSVAGAAVPAVPKAPPVSLLAAVPAAAAASEVVALPENNPLFSTDVMCSSCGRHEAFKKCRLISKKTGRWQCSGCGCKAVMLRRSFGHWPTDAFTNLSPDCM